MKIALPRTCHIWVVATALFLSAQGTQSLSHGWDCISCPTNSMLIGNFGTWREDFSLDDPWWVNTTADAYAAVMLNTFWTRSYNGTGDDSKILVARAMKLRNPALKVFFYQPADRLGDSAYVKGVLASHPEWWLRDDYGNLIPFGDPRTSTQPQIDPSVEGAQEFFANLSISLFHNREEARSLLDGVMVDGTSWTGASRYGVNVSDARYQKLFDGKMQMLAKLQANLQALNEDAETIGNPLLEYGQPFDSPGAQWNTSIGQGRYSGAFDEMFGAFGTMDKNGSWDVEKMQWSMDSIRNASKAGKTVVVHAYPGPAGDNDPSQGGMFPTRGNLTSGNTFRVAAWAGPEKVPQSADACRQAAQDRLVESLAPFLLVVSETVFLGYGWFYNIEDGYIPCKAGVECGMPSEWFPEFSKPLGAPTGPATTTTDRLVWTRQFAHASVYVDLRNRSLSSIAWH